MTGLSKALAEVKRLADECELVDKTALAFKATGNVSLVIENNGHELKMTMPIEEAYKTCHGATGLETMLNILIWEMASREIRGPREIVGKVIE